MNTPTEWSFAFFDLGSKETSRRGRLHRNLRRVGAAIHSQSVYCMPYSHYSFQRLKDLDDDVFVVKADIELVAAYDIFIDGLMREISQKIDDLEDAKAISTDLATRRGYTKRYNKMNERLDHLEYVLQLRQNPDIMDKVEEFKQRVIQIDDNEPGKLI